MVLEQEGSGHPVAADDWHVDGGTRLVGAWHYAHAVGDGLGERVEDDRRKRLAHPLARPAGQGNRRRDLQALAVLVLVQVMHHPGLGIHQADADVLGAQDLAQFVADQVDDGLEVEFRRHALLDAVDHGHFGRALLGLLEQPLRLVE